MTARPAAPVVVATASARLPVDARIRATLDRLKSITRTASIGFALEVGRAVVEGLYQGDPTGWRTRARKDYALRILAASPELPVSASALYRALAIYELHVSTECDVTAWRHLGASHVRAVLGLDTSRQMALLSAAERAGWTVARLEREALQHRSAARIRGGRRPIPSYVKAIRQIHKLTAPEALEGLEHSDALAADDLVDLVEKVNEARARLASLAELLPRPRRRAC
jgi:hypothetical protein